MSFAGDLDNLPAPLSGQDAKPLASDRKGIGQKQWAWAAIITVLLAVVPAVIWPGDISWMYDEPLLVGQAHWYNVSHELASRGLGGNFGIPYGPLPTQIYQLLLHFTHDPRHIAVMRALVCSMMLAGSFLWLAASLRITPWFAAAVVLAPYVLWSERVMWDASFALPIGALAVAAYAAFLRRGSAWALGVAATAAMLVPLIHPQGLPLFLALALHFVTRARQSRPSHWLALGLALSFVLVLNAAYIEIALRYLRPRLSTMFSAGYSSGKDAVPILKAAGGPLLGGKLLNGETFARDMSRLHGPSPLIEGAIFVSRAVVPLCWIGIVYCICCLLARFLSRKASGELGAGSQSPPARQLSAQHTCYTMMSIALICILLQTALATALRLPPQPQYTFGTYPIHVLIAWFGIEALRRIYLGTTVTAIWGLSLAVVTVGSALQIHREGWRRDSMGPTLGNQIEVAKMLNRYSDEAVQCSVQLYKKDPEHPQWYCTVALRELRTLLPPDPLHPPSHSPRGLVLRYRDGPNSASSVIELIEIQSNSDIPSDAEEIDVRPMPKIY